jgi:hypothetical protein
MRLRTSTRSVVARFRDRKGGVAIEPFRRPEVTLHVDVDNEVALALLGLGEVLERVRLPGAAPAVDDAVAARPQRTDEGAFLDVGVEDVLVAADASARSSTSWTAFRRSEVSTSLYPPSSHPTSRQPGRGTADV